MNLPAQRSHAPRPDEPSRTGIRAKVFYLVLLATLLPTVLVGTSAYWTARDVLTEKLSERLTTRASLAAASISEWFQERGHDASVFANSNLVTSGDPSLIEAYLVEVRGRFPMYSTLAVVDTQGRRVASVGRIRELGLVDTNLALEWSEDAPALLIRSPIRESGGAIIGTFVMSCDFESLRTELFDEGASERLILLSPDESEDRVVMAQPPDASLPRVSSYAADENTLSERRDPSGSRTLATARSLDVPGLDERLIVHVETERRAAFAAVDELRNRVVAISAVVAIFVIALAFGLGVSLTRPLESLTVGVQAVSNGDYTLELPVRTRDEIGYLTEVFNHMTAALKQSYDRLEHLSTTDELTRLVNRRQLRTALASTLQRAKRSEAPFSLIMLDIDHFKAFNDKFGHIKGDELLSKLGAFLLKSLRATDTAARYGGEEFLIILPETELEAAKEKAQSIRAGFSEICDGPRKATLSLGVAAWPRDGDAGEEVLDAADRALYSAKKQGRDRVVVARKRARQRTSAR